MNEAEHAKLFEEVENASLLDAYTLQTIAKARALERLSDRPYGVDVTELEMLERHDAELKALRELDADCPYLLRKVRVSGRVTRSYYDELNEKYEVEKVDFIDHIVTAHGFTSMQTVNSRHVVGHLFLTDIGQPFQNGMSLVNFVPRFYAFAPVGSVEIDTNPQD